MTPAKLTKDEQKEPLFVSIGRLKTQIEQDYKNRNRQLALLNKIIEDIREGRLL